MTTYGSCSSAKVSIRPKRLHSRRSPAGSSPGHARWPGVSPRCVAAFAAAPAGVDGHGATAFAIAQQLDAAVEEAAAAVERQHTDELEAFDAEMERLGYAERDAQRMRRRIDERHKRETRRTRIDLLLEGVTAIESVYRDVLASPAPALNSDRPGLRLAPRAAAAALDACHRTREAFLINEKGLLRLIALLMELPPAGTA